MRPNPTKPARSKRFAVLSASVLLGIAVGSHQINVPWADSPLGLFRKASRDAFDRGDHEGSAKLALQGLADSSRQHHRRAELIFLQFVGSTRLLQHRYAEALVYLLRAEKVACAAADRTACAPILSNLANLYLTIGDYGAARIKATQALAAGGHVPILEAPLRTTLGRIAALQSDTEAAEYNLSRGAAIADQLGNDAAYSFALVELGRWKLVSGDLVAAEAILSSAFKSQVLRRDRNIAYTYMRLASLKLRQGDAAFALRLNNAALDHLGRGNMALAPYYVWQERGPILEALGEMRLAADCYRRATELARAWRDKAGPADRIQTVLADGLRGSIYDRFVALSATLAVTEQNGQRAWEAFEALEENRSSALRNAARRPRSGDKASLVLAGRMASSQPRDSGENFSGRKTLSYFQSRLQESELFFSFAISRYGCHRWAISRMGFTLQSLEGCAGLGRLVAEFREALQHQHESVALGRELYARLFANLPRHARQKKDWIFSLDDALWELPLPALVESVEGGKPVYLIERHSVTTVPGALSTFQPSLISPRGRLVGFGDPVYNLADVRRKPERVGWFSLGAMTNSVSQAAPLNRLVASGREVLHAARTWEAAGGGREAIVLTGTNATRDRLFEELKRPAAAIHIAAHVLPKSEKDESAIAASIRADGSAEVVTVADIAAANVAGALVILNGCSSGRGEIHRGAGLFGLTRAWLLAGAGAVIASQWDTPDDASGLFPSFYRYWMKDSLPAAEALRRAQIDMLHSGGWRANPGFWAAYSMTGGAK